MSRKSTSTQRRSGGRKSGSSRTRSTSSNPGRQSASSQRGSAKSGGSRSRSRGRGNRREDNQEWNFSQTQRAYGEPRREDERSFASRDYDRGRDRPAYASQSGSGRGFASMDPERRRELASRGGRASHGRSPGSEQDERRFTREIDSYYGRPHGDYGRPPGDQDFRDRGDFREDRGDHAGRFRDREFRDEGAYRSSGRESDRGDWRMSDRDYDHAPSSRPDWRGDFPREEGYQGDDRGYEGSFREGGRYDREDDDRFYSGRGPRDRESEHSGSHRPTGGRTRSTRSRRRE